MSQLTAGKTFEPVPAALNGISRHGIQPDLISYFRYDPAKEIAGLSIPVFIIQGTTDIDVTVEDAKFLAKAKPSAKLVLIEGMNHRVRH